MARQAKQENHPHKLIGQRIGRAIREQRTAMNLSQAELARQVDITRETMRSIESGRRQPSVGIAVSLFAALKMDAAKFTDYGTR